MIADGRIQPAKIEEYAEEAKRDLAIDIKKTGEEAFYVWETAELKHVYSAACTITCFPIFYSVQLSKPKSPSLLDQMKNTSLQK